MFSLVFTGEVVGASEVARSLRGAEWSLAVLADPNDPNAEGIAVLFVSGVRYIFPEETAAEMLGKRYKFHCDEAGVAVFTDGLRTETELTFHVSRADRLA